MTMSHVANDPIRYRDQAFAVHHLIDDCPPFTVVRELLKNAEEAAMTLDPPGRIEWFAEQVDGVRKLGLYNEGPGMSGEQLETLMDLASTGKTLGTNANYGQGGKISALRVSPFGVVYRSCKDGMVGQIILAAEHRDDSTFPIYVKRRFPVVDADGVEEWDVVLDITDRYAGRSDRSLNKQWTEVVLLGRSVDQDTVADLIPGYEVKSWLMRLIQQRFYRFPKGVAVSRANITTGQSVQRNATGLQQVTENHTEHHEDVEASHPKYGPVSIRYVKLSGAFNVDDEGNTRAKTMEAYGIGSRGDHICVVWRNECYNLMVGWSKISGMFGVTFGSANIAIHIILPDDAPVKNNTYRDAIIDRDGENLPVKIDEFAEMVRLNRPQWLIDYIEEEARKNTSGEGVSERLKAYLDELKAAAAERKHVEGGDGEDQGEQPIKTRSGGGGAGGGGGRGRDTDETDPTSPTHKPQVGRKMQSRTVGVPHVAFTSDQGILAEMGGRAAIYKKEENSVFLNPEHFKYQQDLERIYEDTGPDAELRVFAKQLFDEEYCVSAGRFVIQAWFNRGRPEFRDEDFESALSVGSLTVTLASPSSVDEARRKLRMKMQSKKREGQA